jgi:hypothetical protein
MALSLLVDTRFQVLLTPLTGVLFTFPSRYWFTIGRQGVFRLTRWSSQIQAGLHVSRLTWELRSAEEPFRLRGSHPLWPAFPDGSPTLLQSSVRSRYPDGVSSGGLASSAFARHYWRNRIFLSSPRGTEMFHFPRFARARLSIQRAVRRHYPPWVSPFGHLRIKAWLAAPRSLSQLPASFFASCRLGIHRVPFPAWSSSLSSTKTKVQPGRPASWLTDAALPSHFVNLATSLSCAYAVVKDRKIRCGGADRDRTDDFQLAKLALSQLSYGPRWLVGLDRFELSTPRLSSVCSNQLSYRPSPLPGSARIRSTSDLQRAEGSTPSVPQDWRQTHGRRIAL